MLLHKGLTHKHSQKDSRLNFGEFDFNTVNMSPCSIHTVYIHTYICTCIPAEVAHLFMSPIFTPTHIPWDHSVKSHVMNVSEATPNWAALWSRSSSRHMNVSLSCSLQTLLPAAAHGLFVLHIIIIIIIITTHTHTHTQRCVWQQSVALTCEWISVERCCKLCKQRWDVFSNDSSPHPLPQLLICLHPSKTRRAASGSAQTTTHDELMMDTWCNMAVSLQLPSVSVSDVMKQLMVPSPPVTDWLLQINTCCYRSELLHTYTGVWFYLLSLLCC